MIRVYVAGKYSDNNVLDVLNNIRKGIKASRELFMMGYAVFCPWLDCMYCLTMTDSEWSAIDVKQFYDYSMAWLEASHCVFLLPERTEDSKGVQAELARAAESGIPVFTEIEDLKKWAKISEGLHSQDQNGEPRVYP